MLLERRVDGMIFISSELTDLRSDHRHYVRLREEGARFVSVNGSGETLEVTSVGVDERAAGKLATEHLLQLGHRRIGFAAGYRSSLPTRDKAEGRSQALLAAGIEPDGLVAHASFSVEGGRSALRELLAAPDGPTDRRPLLERPDGHRRADGGRCSGARRSRRPLRCRLRRHRGRLLDATGTDHDRAADRRHRHDCGRGAQEPDRRARPSSARLRIQAETPGASLYSPSEGDTMSKIVIDHVTKIYAGRREGHRRRHAGDLERRVHGARRAVRLRQVDAHAHGRRPRGRHRGVDPDRRGRRDSTSHRATATSRWSSRTTPSTRT